MFPNTAKLMLTQNQREEENPMYLEYFEKIFLLTSTHPTTSKSKPIWKKEKNHENKKPWQVIQMAAGYIVPRILCSFNRCLTSRRFWFAKSWTGPPLYIRITSEAALDKPGTYWGFRHLPLLHPKWKWHSTDSTERRMREAFYLPFTSTFTKSRVKEQSVQQQPGFPADYQDRSSSSARVRIKTRVTC